MTVKIENFLDKDGKLKQWPSKTAAKEASLAYIAAKFSPGRVYTEKEVNAVISEWHTFGDYFILRRGMVEAGLLTRTADGSEYRLSPSSDPADAKL